MWFRRDLRTHDHPALRAAIAQSRGRSLLPLFVIDPVEWQEWGEPARAHVTASLRALADDLGGLHVRVGDPVAVLTALAGELGPLSVHVSADHAPRVRRRDAAVAAALVGSGSRLVASGSHYAVPPGTVLKPDRTAYRVFTPFHRAWEAVGWPAPVAPGPRPHILAVSGAQSPPPVQLPAGLVLPPAGERAAQAAWRAFADGPLAQYDTDRDRPDLPGTSRMSVHLRWGEVHPRTLLAGLGSSRAHVRFRTELAWREFYADVLHRHPETESATLDPTFATMQHDEGPEAEQAFTAWAHGRTGYPFVDAGMRQLRTEGWMHNRVRMVVASFLVKDLHLPWWRGAAEFMRWLVDGDVASNAHGWQWVAGCGTDAAPYIRVFNPVTQGLRFDPGGDYVRRHVPELRDLPGAAAHEPWRHPARRRGDYPDRIVDHAEERAEALRRFAAVR